MYVEGFAFENVQSHSRQTKVSIFWFKVDLDGRTAHPLSGVQIQGLFCPDRIQKLIFQQFFTDLFCKDFSSLVKQMQLLHAT